MVSKFSFCAVRCLPVGNQQLPVGKSATVCIGWLLQTTWRNFVGDAGLGDYRDGPAAQARFTHPRAVALGADGSLYVAGQDNTCIRIIKPAGRRTPSHPTFNRYPMSWLGTGLVVGFAGLVT